MKSFKEIVEQLKSGPTDVVGIELASYGTPVVRMRKGNDGATVTDAEILPRVTVSETEGMSALSLPGKLKGKHACVTVSGDSAIVKLLSFPGHFGEESEQKLIESLGLDKPDEYRISYKVIGRGHGKSESRVLTVALPKSDADIVNRLLPAGLPAPFSLEISGLATLSAFLNGPGAEHSDTAIGAIHFGDSVSSFALFNKTALSLIRRFDVGTETVLAKVQESLGVDKETAEGIMSDGSFDISQVVTEVLAPVVKQMVVSRDFLERRENCQLSGMYVSGGLTLSRDSLEEMSSSLGVEMSSWNPFDGVSVAPGAVPESVAGKEWQFSGALGAGLGTFEET